MIYETGFKRDDVRDRMKEDLRDRMQET